MNLYLIRHAEAVELGENGITEDADRVLTSRGEQQAKAMGKFFKSRGLSIDRVVSSPYARAQQTAELMLKTSGLKVEIESTESLTPNARSKKLARYLMKTGGEHVALVGHLPHLGDFAAWSIGDKKAQIDFEKAGVALISTGDSPIKGNGVLHWLITPEWFS